MIILISGKNGSGKSLYAEKAACMLSTGEMYYVATMIPYGDEGIARINWHRAQRSGKGFKTIESPYGDISGITGTVLLEDVSNLLANIMFERRLPCPEDETILQISRLCHTADHIIIVSISDFGELSGSDDDTRTYIRLLNDVNLRLMHMADVAIEMDSGVPIVKKGGSLWKY